MSRARVSSTSKCCGSAWPLEPTQARQLHARHRPADEHAIDLHRQSLLVLAVGDDVELVRAGEGDHLLAVGDRRLRQRHDVLADAQAQAVDTAGEPVDGAQEAVGESGGRLLVDLLRRAHLLDLALVHHHDAVGHLQRLFLVVGDEDRGDVQLVVQPAQPAPQLLAHLGVERAERLVQQQHLRLDRQRARQRHALPLAAGELRRIAVGRASRAAPARSSSLHALRDLGFAQARIARGLTRRPKAMFSNTVMCRNRA